MTQRAGGVAAALVWFAVTLSGSTALAAGPLALITPDEVRAEEQAQLAEPPATRAFPVPGSPKIQVLQPELSGATLRNPIRIVLKFASAADAAIDPASFRAYYGLLRVDITKRIVQSVRVAESGLTVDEAEIPPGKHRLLLRIADTRERVTETEVRFAVD